MHDAAQREEFKGHMHMLHIDKIEGKKSKQEQNKFIITARNVKNQQTREFMFRCENEQMRDEWADGLDKYLHYFQDMQSLFS